MILWIIIGVLWTAFVAIVSLLLGMTYATRSLEEKLAKSKSGQSLSKNIYKTAPGPQGPPGAIGAMGPAGKDGKTPDVNDLIVDPDLEMSLAEWKVAVEARLKRVEKKAGMSV